MVNLEIKNLLGEAAAVLLLPAMLAAIALAVINRIRADKAAREYSPMEQDYVKRHMAFGSAALLTFALILFFNM